MIPTEIKNKIDEIANVFDWWEELEYLAEDGKHQKTFTKAQAALDEVIVALSQDLVELYRNENNA